MQAYAFDAPMAGLPDPEDDRQFYDGVPLRRGVAWLIDVAIILAVGLPLATLFGIATLGMGFAIFPVVVATVGFCYRTATIAGGSATWGMRFVGIELRRADGSRFDFLTAVLHTAIYTLAISFIVLQLVSMTTILGTRYGQGLPDLLLRTTALRPPAE
jgi:uncharacterized RDD family membrane protein YckC